MMNRREVCLLLVFGTVTALSFTGCILFKDDDSAPAEPTTQIGTESEGETESQTRLLQLAEERRRAAEVRRLKLLADQRRIAAIRKQHQLADQRRAAEIYRLQLEADQRSIAESRRQYQLAMQRSAAEIRKLRRLARHQDHSQIDTQLQPTSIRRAPRNQTPPLSSSPQLLIFGGHSRKVFLGCLNCSQFHAKSVHNEFGTYGNEFSQQSILNGFSEYGSSFSNYSACNDLATEAPVVVDRKGRYYGRLTLNDLGGQIKSASVIAWLKRVCAGR